MTAITPRRSPDSVRVADACQLDELTKNAAHFKLNRQLSAKALDEIDPDGYSILTMLLFDHDRGRSGDPMHHRVQAYLKMKNQADPFMAIIDVTHKDWEDLSHVEWILTKKD